MFALGNEVYQDRMYTKGMLDKLREYDNRHLYAQGSNNFGGNPSLAIGDDYWTTFRTALEKPDCSTDVRSSISFVDARNGGILNTLNTINFVHVFTCYRKFTSTGYWTRNWTISGLSKFQ